MSLLDESYEKFILMDRRTTDDGYGGVVTEWVEGATIWGALVLDNSNSARIAQSLGVTDVYTLTVRKDTVLDYHDIIKRSDGKYFRITNDSDDKRTPASAGLNMRQYSAESWRL